MAAQPQTRSSQIPDRSGAAAARGRARQNARALGGWDQVSLVRGLDSLGLAVVVVRLADSLGMDPFGYGKGAASPVTFGELVRMYESPRG
jgi:hypothetical protein